MIRLVKAVEIIMIDPEVIPGHGMLRLNPDRLVIGVNYFALTFEIRISNAKIVPC